VGWVAREIDQTIQSLKQARRYLYGKQIAQQAAAKKLDKEWETHWTRARFNIQKAGFTQEQVYKELDGVLNET
jgi:hypothetical protein